MVSWHEREQVHGIFLQGRDLRRDLAKTAALVGSGARNEEAWAKSNV
ncbi:hypothetical protein CCACVL1_29071 [Corchorus capsularis]|uniref:Uncharacterized protein n=1 Tax=Corchorus capsularis TaxID=210143 RepID=A0A1R3G408_COCAP|nr:hypothetical protein CCACVL1_29071 [Corchorus capsularis]